MKLKENQIIIFRGCLNLDMKVQNSNAVDWLYSITNRFLKFFAQLKEKHLSRRQFFSKLSWLQLFPITLANFFREAILQDTCERFFMKINAVNALKANNQNTRTRLFEVALVYPFLALTIII